MQKKPILQTKPPDPLLPPHSLELERSALGCVLLASGAGSQAEVEALLTQLRPGLFYDLRCKSVHDAMARLQMAGHAVDLVTLHQQLKAEGLLSQVGMDFIQRLPEAAPSALNFPTYLEELRGLALRRWSLQTAAAMSDKARNGGVDVAELRRTFAELEERAGKIGQSSRPLIELYSVEDLKRYEPDPRTFLVGANLICRGEVSLVAGSVGVGKSRLLTTLALAGARGRGNWMGYEIKRKFRTLILQAQNSLCRLKSEVQGVDESVNGWIRFSRDTTLAFHRPEFRGELRRIYQEWPFDVLGLDPWNVIARKDDLEATLLGLAWIKESLPEHPERPAVMIVCHTRKDKGGEQWAPKTGRELTHEVSGSQALIAEARSAFTVQPVTMDYGDDRIVFDCMKCSNEIPLPMSAWHRRNGEFRPCTPSEWDRDEWLNSGSRGQRGIGEADVAAVFEGGRRLTRREAVEWLVAAGFKQATAYRATDPMGRFTAQLSQDEKGRLVWKEQT